MTRIVSWITAGIILGYISSSFGARGAMVEDSSKSSTFNNILKLFSNQLNEGAKLKDEKALKFYLAENNLQFLEHTLVSPAFWTFQVDQGNIVTTDRKSSDAFITLVSTNRQNALIYANENATLKLHPGNIVGGELTKIIVIDLETRKFEMIGNFEKKITPVFDLKVKRHQIISLKAMLGFNRNPEIRMNWPDSGSVVSENRNIHIRTVPTVLDDEISHVDFFASGNLIGTVACSPYHFTWFNVKAGRYKLTSKLSDVSGVTGVSSPVVLSVRPKEEIYRPLSHPCLFINDEELKAIRSKVLKGEEPWKSAYQNMLERAREGLSKGPWGMHPLMDHEWADGKKLEAIEKSKNSFRAYSEEFGNYLINIALAWHFTKEEKYTQKATELIHHWFFNPESYMKPVGATVGLNSSFMARS